MLSILKRWQAGFKMSQVQASSLSSFIRGGQITIHFFRMTVQIIKQYIKFCIALYLIVTSIIFYLSTSEYDRYVTARYVMANIAVEGLKNGDRVVTFRVSPDSDHEIKTKMENIATHPSIRKIVGGIKDSLIWSLACAAFGILFFIPVGLKFTQGIGKAQTKDKHVRGSKIKSETYLISKLKRNEELGKIKISNIPIPKRFETSHLLIMGGPGTGKSTCFKGILETIRKNNQKAICYDIAGSYVNHFYREGKDIILNPLDERCASWDIWADSKAPWHYLAFANSLIPDRSIGSDPFWSLAARIVLSSIAERMADMEDRSTSLLVNQLLNVPLDTMVRFLENTDAISVLSEDAEKMAISIRATMATYSQSLKYLPEPKKDEKIFSIRDWVADEDDDRWVFITSTEEQKETLKPLITAWIDIASSSILSMTENSNRRIWLMIDELPTLNRVPSLMNTLTNSRKFGGCGVIGFQSYPQLCEIYGQQGANGIAEACSTWVVHRANGRDSAEWAAKAMGDVEHVETVESVQYGVNDIRDGVSLNKQKKSRQLVIPSELLNLPDLQGFIRLGRDYPVVRFKSKYRSYDTLADGFVLRKFENKKFTNNETPGIVETELLKNLKRPELVSTQHTRLVVQMSLFKPHSDAKAVADEMSRFGIPIIDEAVSAIWKLNDIDTIDKRLAICRAMNEGDSNQDTSLEVEEAETVSETEKDEFESNESVSVEPEESTDKSEKTVSSPSINQSSQQQKEQVVLQILDSDSDLSTRTVAKIATMMGTKVSPKTVHRIMTKHGYLDKNTDDKEKEQEEIDFEFKTETTQI